MGKTLKRKGDKNMKKMRKIFAVLLSLAMVLGMSITSFAAGESNQETPATTASKGSITVQGLVPNEKTTLSIYKVVGWDAAKSEWKLEEGITNKEVTDLKKNPITIDWAEIAKNRDSLTPIETKENVDTTSVTFDNLDIGAYYVYAQSSKTTYNPMGEAVYEYDTDGLMKPANKTIDAKGSTYTLTKTFTDANGETTYKVVERGQEISFTITAVFPSYDKDTEDRTFQITDEPTGMKVTDVKVKVNGSELSKGTDYTLVNVVTETGADGSASTLPTTDKVRVRFTKSFIGIKGTNTHAGQTVTVEVKAQITDAATFTNKASSDKGYNKPEVSGKLGSITINKYDENYGATKPDNKLLAGAEFSIAPIGENNTVGGKLQFVLVKEGEYKLATADDTANKVTNVVATNGTVKVTGLNDGTYKIVEEKAPAGYSVVEVKENAIITNGNNPNATVNVSDTKLHSLPHTGGIGTTIFTIAGCLIMIAAAGLFFASRKKTNK